MQTIFKYPLQVAMTQRIDLPLRHTFATLQLQSGIPCAWFFVDAQPNAPQQERLILMMGTGMPKPEEAKAQDYLGSVVMADGMVWHYFMPQLPTANVGYEHVQ